MALRRELIDAAFPEPVADDATAMPVLSDEALAASLRATLAALGERRELWLFAYGSLMWRPEPGLVEHRLGTVQGWHRRFCLWQWRFRGGRERPGLMLAIDRGGACRGMAYRIAGPGIEAKLAGVWRREMRGQGYLPRQVRVATAAGPVDALTFVANRQGARYAGRLDDRQIAAHIARACGHVGPSADYLLETVARCEALGIRDRHLWRLQALVAAELAGTAAPG